jgi:hypothetical protein
LRLSFRQKEQAMAEDVTPRKEASHKEALPPAGPAGIVGIGRARKIRLVVLLCILAGSLGGYLLLRSSLARKERERHEALTTALTELRGDLNGLDPSASSKDLGERFAHAVALWQNVQQLDPGNRDADRLGVALWYAAGRYADALTLFNALDVKQIRAEVDKEANRKATQALDPFPILQADAVDAEIGRGGEGYLRRCGLLWGLGRTIAPATASDKEKALQLCRWMALHLLPEPLGDLPADPYIVAWRGYGSPAELAWTYAELARQMSLCSEVVVPASAGAQNGREYLVQVYIGEGKTILVNPHLGAPLIDPASGEPLSLTALADRPDAYRSLAASGSSGSAYQADMFKAVELKTALDPPACYPRFLVFEHLLSVLPVHPHVAFASTGLPADRQVDLWEAPIDILHSMDSRGYAERVEKAYAALALISDARTTHLSGAYDVAGELYGSSLANLKNAMPKAEVKEASAVFSEAVEAASFFAAVNAYDSGDGPRAEKQLRDYVAQYPSGRWRTLAALILGEVLTAAGDKAGAEDLWRGLPDARRLYVTLRSKGLMPEAVSWERGVKAAPPAARQPAVEGQAAGAMPGAAARPPGAPSP